MSTTISLLAMRWLIARDNADVKHHRKPTILYV